MKVCGVCHAGVRQARNEFGIESGGNGMTPDGKVTTANLERDTVVLISPTATGWEPATRKTDAVEAKVHKVERLATHAAFGRRAASRYRVTLAIETRTPGEMVETTAVPAQTWWLASSGKKRA
jgi:hypothetical protein